MSRSISRVNLGDAESSYALIVTAAGSYLATDDIQEVEISYPSGGSLTEGWLDYIEMQAQRKLIAGNNTLIFRSFESVGYNRAGFSVNEMSKTT